MAKEPITNLDYQESNTQQTDELQNDELNYWAAWTNPVVLAVNQAAPTGSEANGDRYIVGTGTGLFAGKDKQMAVLRDATWRFYPPVAAGVPLVKNLGDGADWEFLGGVWAAKAGGGTIDIAIVTEASAFTATVLDHAGKDRMVLAGGDVTFDNTEGYATGRVFNVLATAAIELIESGVTLTPPAGGTLELDADMTVTVLMTGATTGRVIGQTVTA